MKKIYLLATILLGLSAQLMAQAPQGINYQAVIRNPNGTTVNNSNISLQMRILQGSASGTAVYVETFTETTSNIGLVNIVIGTGTVVAGDFTTIDWGNGPYFMEVGADTGGGTGYVVMGTQQMMSVPYALYAENSGTPGPQGPQGIQGDPGPQGPTGATGPQGPAGATGPQGPQGVAGPQGPAGTDGLDGTDGVDGLSAYDVWLSQGNTGTEADFLTSLQGADGAVGATGPQGPQGVAGPQGPAGADGQGGVTTAGTNISITGTGTVGDPYVVNATDNVDDADSDPTNELQTLSLSNDTLYISNGNNITIGNSNGNSNVELSLNSHSYSGPGGFQYIAYIDTINISPDHWAEVDFQYSMPTASGFNKYIKFEILNTGGDIVLCNEVTEVVMFNMGEVRDGSCLVKNQSNNVKSYPIKVTSYTDSTNPYAAKWKAVYRIF